MILATWKLKIGRTEVQASLGRMFGRFKHFSLSAGKSGWVALPVTSVLAESLK
jgi:hypothetical protein